MASSESKEEQAKALRRKELEGELFQLTRDFAHVVDSNQPNYRGQRGELPPQVTRAEDASGPNCVVFAFNMNGDAFVPNAHTIGQSVGRNGSVKTIRCLKFLGMGLDTVGFYHASTCGVTTKQLTPGYRQPQLFGRAAQSLMSTPHQTVIGYMEAIRLPRDTCNKHFDTMTRLWFVAMKSGNHVTEKQNCAAMKLMLETRLALRGESFKKGQLMSLGADDATDLHSYTTYFLDYYDGCQKERDHVRSADFQVNLGLVHPEVCANPFSRKMFAMKDQDRLRQGLDKEVLELRDRAIANANNPYVYFQQYESLGRVFRPHVMDRFYKLPDFLLKPSDVSLMSQNLESVKTPLGLEESMPQHVKMCDTHIELHRRASNQKHYENLRDRLPLATFLHEENVLQPEWVTSKGYWVLSLPSTVERANLCKKKSPHLSQAEYVWDVMDGIIKDQSVHFLRCDCGAPTRAVRPGNVSLGREDDGALSDAHVSSEDESEDEIDRIMRGDDNDVSDSAASQDNPYESDDVMLGQVSVDEDDGCSTGMRYQDKWEEFLINVDRFVNGCIGDERNSIEVPAYVLEQDREGSQIPFQDDSSESECSGAKIILPQFVDWVQAVECSAASNESRLDTIVRESREQERSVRVTSAIRKAKLLLSKSGFQTEQICLVDETVVYKRDNTGEVCTEPQLDEQGNTVLDEDGFIVEVPVVERRVPVKLGVHFARPKWSNPKFRESCRIVKHYCTKEIAKGKKKLPVLDNTPPKYKEFSKGWVDGNFSDDVNANAPSRCQWEKAEYQHINTKNLNLYIENGVESDVKGLNPGPNKTRAQRSVTEHLHIVNTTRFENGEMGIGYLNDLGHRWVVEVAKSTNAEHYVKEAIQPWFEETYKLDPQNRWVLKDSVRYPDVVRVDPDHDFSSVWETTKHAVFDHIGSVYNQYKFCHLVYAVFGTAFRKPNSRELAEWGNLMTPANLKIVGGTETGKSHKCSHTLCLFQRDRHVIDDQGNSALCGIGVLLDDRECVMGYSDETNEDKDQETLRQEKMMKTQGYISRGRSLKKMCPDGVERYFTDRSTNRTLVANVSCVNEEAKGGENVIANENRNLKVYAAPALTSFHKPKDMHGAKCRNLKDAILAKHFEDPRVSKEGKRVMQGMVEHTERIAAMESFITTIGSPEARDVNMTTAHIRWKSIANFLSNKGVVWNDRPRLYETMLKLARFLTVELAVLAAFEAQRRPDGSKIPFTPENYWEVLPYLFCTESTACKTFHYCSTQSMGVNYNFPIMNALFEVIAVHHKHDTDDEAGVRDRFMQSAKYDKRYFVAVFKKTNGPGRYAKTQIMDKFPYTLKRRWANAIQSMYGIDKQRHDLKKDWDRLCKAKGSLADLRVTPQTEEYTIDNANQESEHEVYSFADLDQEARQRLPILEVVDPEIDAEYCDNDVLEAVILEEQKGAPPANDGDKDYSHDTYIIIQISWAAMRHVVEQRHALANNRDMKDEPVVDVVKEFEKVKKGLIQEAFVQVCSYKNNMACPRIMEIARIKEAARENGSRSWSSSADARYFRQKIPGLRGEKCLDGNKKLEVPYKCMTIAEPPTWHGGQVLNATIPDTLVIKEDRKNEQNFNVDVNTITSTAAALGEAFYKAKVQSMKKTKDNKPLHWNIDLRTHYERFLKLCHPKSGLFRGATSYDGETLLQYNPQWSEERKRRYFIDVYCDRFPPYSVLVLNLPVSDLCGHTPQCYLAEYIDQSRRSQNKRKRRQTKKKSNRSRNRSNSTASETGEESFSGWFSVDAMSAVPAVVPAVVPSETSASVAPVAVVAQLANLQEGSSSVSSSMLKETFEDGEDEDPLLSEEDESDEDQNMIKSDGDDVDMGDFIVSDDDEESDDAKRQKIREAYDMLSVAENNQPLHVPPSVLNGGDSSLVISNRTYREDSNLPSNPFVDDMADV